MTLVVLTQELPPITERGVLGNMTSSREKDVICADTRTPLILAIA